MTGWKPVLCAVVAAALLVALSVSAGNQLPPVLETREAGWLSEEDFALNDALHATIDQAVLLHLEGRDDSATGGRGRRDRGAIRRNSFRLLVEEARDFSFCIPEDEPYIVRLRLKGPISRGKARMGTVLIARGDACETVTLVPGSHTVEVDHDSRDIPAGGTIAFFHQPQKTRLQGDGQTGFVNPDFLSARPNAERPVAISVPPFSIQGLSFLRKFSSHSPDFPGSTITLYRRRSRELTLSPFKRV